MQIAMVSIPDICQFWYATALSRLVKSTQKITSTCDKIAIMGKHVLKSTTARKEYATAA